MFFYSVHKYFLKFWAVDFCWKAVEFFIDLVQHLLLKQFIKTIFNIAFFRKIELISSIQNCIFKNISQILLIFLYSKFQFQTSFESYRILLFPFLKKFKILSCVKNVSKKLERNGYHFMTMCKEIWHKFLQLEKVLGIEETYLI